MNNMPVLAPTFNTDNSLCKRLSALALLPDNFGSNVRMIR